MTKTVRAGHDPIPSSELGSCPKPGRGHPRLAVLDRVPKSLTVLPRAGATLLELLRARGIRIPSDCGGEGTCGKCRVSVRDADGPHNILACRFVPTSPVTVSVPQGARRPRTVARAPVVATRRLAVDVGTTTLSFAVVDTRLGRVIRRHDELNPQVVFGADVMSRIAQAGRVKSSGLHEQIAAYMAENGIDSAAPVTAVANTVMSHFLAGKDPASLGEYPYRSQLPLGKTATARTHGLRLKLLPLLGGFVGSDCTAAILASGMARSRRLTLLVDAGTNGEVVLGNREGMLVCSTAAGPAFEGATLECGSLAQPGAVRSVAVRRGKLVLDVVGRGTPRSICGSGVLDAVAAGLRLGAIDRSGRLSVDPFRLSERVHLSQSDVREVQLAKGAIAAAIRVLLAERGERPQDLERIFITGRFGAALNVDSAIAVGLLPNIAPQGHDRNPPRASGRVPSQPFHAIRRHGNLALAGAVRVALDPTLIHETERIAAACREVRLAEHELFETAFAEGMSLCPWQ